MKEYVELTETVNKTEREMYSMKIKEGSLIRLNLLLIKLIQLADLLDTQIALELDAAKKINQ